jgi:hypothetical protein
MFDRDDYGFDPLEDYIKPAQAEELSKDLANIIDRFYHGGSDDDSDFEEMEISIRHMADILNVRVPKIKSKPPEYVEEMIELYICKPEHIYNHATPYASLSYIRMFLSMELKGILTEKDIYDFCYSDFYKRKREEAKCALKIV